METRRISNLRCFTSIISLRQSNIALFQLLTSLLERFFPRLEESHCALQNGLLRALDRTFLSEPSSLGRDGC